MARMAGQPYAAMIGKRKKVVAAVLFNQLYPCFSQWFALACSSNVGFQVPLVPLGGNILHKTVPSSPNLIQHQHVKTHLAEGLQQELMPV